MLTAAENARVKAMLIRVVSMLTKLVQRRHQCERIRRLTVISITTAITTTTLSLKVVSD